MTRDVEEAVSTCHTCQICKRGLAPKKVPLTPIKVPGEPFARIACDCLTLTTTTRGNRYAVVFKDYLTKWPEVFAVPDIKAETIADCLVQVIARHGCPREILTDRGSCYMSEVFTTVCRRLGIKNLYTTSYNPKGDGMVERFNRTLNQVLRSYVTATQQDWDEYLPFVLAAYRASIHSSTNDSPFFLLYGRDMTTPIDLLLSPPPERQYADLDDYKEDLVVTAHDAWMRALVFVERAQSAYKTAYDRTAVPTKLRRGALVLVKVHNVSPGRMRKLGPLWKGPFRIVDLTPSIAFLQSVADPAAPKRWHNLCNVKPYRQSAAMPKPDARLVPTDPFLRTNLQSDDPGGDSPTISTTLPMGRRPIASAPDTTSFASADTATTPPTIILNDDDTLAKEEGEGSDLSAGLDELPGSHESDDESAATGAATTAQPAGQAVAADDAVPEPRNGQSRQTGQTRQRRSRSSHEPREVRRSSRIADNKARRESRRGFRAHYPSDDDD